MQNHNFCENLNSVFLKNAPELRYEVDKLHNGFVTDDNENKINTIPIPEYEDRYLSLNNSESYIYLSICSYGHCTDIVRIKSNALFNKSTFISCFGNKPFATFNNDSWHMFFRIINITMPECEQRVVYEYSGWSKDLDKYLFGNLSITADEVSSIQTTLVKTDTVLSEKAAADVCKNINNIFRNISCNELIGYILLIYLLMSHCKQRTVEKCRLCPEFVLSIIGKTNSFKTATSIAIFNTYDGSVSSFEDTPASIRRMFQANKSGVTIIDDYKTSSPSNDAKYEKLVRLSGDSQTTGKYVCGNNVVDELITGLSVITGEKRPQLQQSSYSRILFVDLEQFPISLSFLTELQNSKADMNSFILLFVKFILNNKDFDTECIKLSTKYRDKLLHDTDYTGMYRRYYSMYGWFAAIWDMYIKFLHQYGICTEFDFYTEMKAYIYSQHRMYDDNPIKLFKKGYTELLDSNEIAFISNNSIDGLDFDVIECDSKLFIKSNAVYKKVCRYWSDKGIDFPCSERKLRQELYNAGLLLAHNGKLTVEKKTKDNRSYSGYYLLKNLFMNYGGTDDEKF